MSHANDELGGRDDESRPDPDDDFVRDTLMSLRRPEASDAFRDRLREQFVGGFSAADVPAEDAPEAPVVELQAAHATSGSWARRLPVGLLAAAAIITLMVLAIPGAEAEWSVHSVDGAGSVRLGDSVVSSDDPDFIPRLNEALEQGLRIETVGPLQLTVREAQGLALCLLGNSAIVLPLRTGRFRRRDEGTLVSGSVHVHCDDSVTPVIFDAPGDQEVTIDNATMNIECDDGHACICVLRGSVGVAERLEEYAIVQAGEQRSQCPIRKHPRTDPISNEMQKLLTAFQAVVR